MSQIVLRSQRVPAATTSTHAELAAHEAAQKLTEFLQRHGPVMVLTGAGISTDSGIPDYRDATGAWKRKQPVQHNDFMNSVATRQRYWARSLVGWPVMQHAQPNAAHHQLVRLSAAGLISSLVTQNVDRLHQRAGSPNVIDLHGRADSVVCMSCHFRESRAETHHRCEQQNPEFLHQLAQHSVATAPDGDADLEADFSQFNVAGCPRCGSILKPDVVFFGDNVPKERVQAAQGALQSSNGLLVIGSSLMVFSGFRFCRYAAEDATPIALLTMGATRADHLASLKLSTRIAETLSQCSL